MQKHYFAVWKHLRKTQSEVRLLCRTNATFAAFSLQKGGLWCSAFLGRGKK